MTFFLVVLAIIVGFWFMVVKSEDHSGSNDASRRDQWLTLSDRSEEVKPDGNGSDHA